MDTHQMTVASPISGNSAFNVFERDALEAVAAQFPRQQDALLAQFRAARVTSRENSGAGFFTRFEVDRLKAEPVSLESPAGDVWADVSGFQDPINFLMFLRDGYAVMLEGATLRDSTAGLSLDQLTFQLKTPG